MNILALETSTNICSVAIFIDDKLAEINETNEPRIHSQKLPVFVDDIIKSSLSSINDLDGIAVSAGPGSYTGLRIGMSLAKGLAYASSLPIIPIPTLQSLEKQITMQSEHWVAIHSHRDLVFTQKFLKNTENSDPKCISISELNNIPVFGYGISKYITTENFTEICPSARWIGEIAINKYYELKEENINSVNPLYLTEFNISLDKK
ncbi:MAG: tRNA (adenosine(37)-N6)-threonylcarbamoyltransferase complex dimerization subunit type 1 TsaB [Candidatus Marinimicrobia bacterium]|nr:tRNA (adenosine(37)-N6)-threonylcarbamoyltransferase complex dimerization subunit type 1 TsaB [Candidatus Neomarinimicrobiota bacterium]MBL7023476.1 tRNA (adenosine(37)-N6)-threonylcarbamoyltransferase complex dimerization subunit type 1 TsaB [Candidatus Neomarinimicrobiota bacterium]MBL7109269.1 tRNA (adenosine(37)-N6)-threonylcarbamoyltransferase complex dimerization subunit type 1 TsaB [Candidatus Neomarinimicrobiota bacterium]